MSADVLRRAAALMRERAEAATSPTARGHWFAPDYFAQTFRLPPVETEHWARAGAHIASWSPAVALAVADWLDRAADFYDPPVTGSGPKTRRVTETEWAGRPLDRDLALAVARAYLGET